MSDMTLEQEIVEVVQSMTPEMRQKALELLRGLARPKGEPGWKLIQHARELAFSKADLAEMAQAINDK